MTKRPGAIATDYIEASGRRDFDTVATLLSPGVRFSGPGRSIEGAAPYLEILRGLGLVWERSDIRRVFVDGSEVCVVYDFVTNTSAGSVPIVEWLEIEGGQITSVTIFFDRVGFEPAAAELARRAAG